MYDLRPSKQIERKLVFDTIAAAAHEAGPCIDLPFIGMGGFRFVDFIVANKYLGLHNFISIEHDNDIIARCEYNKPFNTLEVCNKSVRDFLLEGSARRQAVVWFDYECGLSENLKDEIQLLTSTVHGGSYVFITCKGIPERSLTGQGPKQVRKHYEEQLGSFALAFPDDAYSRKSYTSTAARLLRNLMADGFSARSGFSFSPYLRLVYADSNPMVTVGGYFGATDKTAAVVGAIESRFPFLKPADADFVYDVGGFNLTEPERRLFNRAALAPAGANVDADKLRLLGFKDDEINTYRHLMRYVPHYFEALL
jgi:hypothetical protein